MATSTVVSAPTVSCNFWSAWTLLNDGGSSVAMSVSILSVSACRIPIALNTSPTATTMRGKRTMNREMDRTRSSSTAALVW